jgi:hypothetical protein
MKKQLIEIALLSYLLLNISTYSQNSNFVISLDGIDDHVSIPVSLIKNNSDLTIETWFKTEDGGVIIGYQNSDYPFTPYNYVPIIYVGSDGFLRGMFWAGSISPITSTEKFNDGKWHHVAITYSNNSQSFFGDGKLLGTITGKLEHLDMTINQLGLGFTASYPSSSSNWFPFKGQLDETRIWNYERSQFQIEQNMFQNIPKNTTGLIAYWKFDDGAGATALDASGNENHATLQNGIGWELFYHSNIDWAILFDGNDDYAILPDGIISSNNKITVELWFSTVSGGAILGYQNSVYPVLPSSYVPAIYVGLDGKVRGEFWNGSLDPITSSSTYNEGMWHHVALVGDENIQHLYVDGKLIGSKNGIINHVDMISNQFGIANTGTSGQDWPSTNSNWFAFSGIIDEARIWNFALNESQINQIMNGGNLSSNFGLLAHWRFNEGFGNQTQDVTGNGNTAFLVNGPLWVMSRIPVDVKPEYENLPLDFCLYQNYPNPFNPVTTIKYAIPNVGTGFSLSILKVYDILGSEVATLVNEKQSAGNYEVKFDGSKLASGVYFYKLQAGKYSSIRKLLLIK